MSRSYPELLERFLSEETIVSLREESLKFSATIAAKCPDCKRTFTTSISQLKRRPYCPRCSRAKACSSSQRKPFTSEQLSLLQDSVDLESVKKSFRTSKVEFLCPEHGVYFQRIDEHLRGKGCPK